MPPGAPQGPISSVPKTGGLAPTSGPSAPHTSTCISLAPTNHVEDVLLHTLSLVVAAGPVVACAASVVAQEDVFRVEKVADLGVLDAVDHPAKVGKEIASCEQAGRPTLPASALRHHTATQATMRVLPYRPLLIMPARRFT